MISSDTKPTDETAIVPRSAPLGARVVFAVEEGLDLGIGNINSKSYALETI